MKEYRVRTDREQIDRMKRDLKVYFKDMGIDFNTLKEMNRVKPLRESKKVIRLYKPLGYYERVEELSL